jgi:hypothetical protein
MIPDCFGVESGRSLVIDFDKCVKREICQMGEAVQSRVSHQAEEANVIYIHA